MFIAATRALVVILILTASVAPAQSSREREAERRAERLAKVIERTVEQSLDGALRAVEGAVGQLDRYQGWNGRQGVSRIDTTFAFSKDGTVDLTTFNGDITVTGWTRGDANVRAVSDRGSIRYRFSANRITVEAEGYRGRGETSYQLSVPLGVRVILRSMSGNLTVRGVKGSVDAHTNNGDVEVVDAAQRVDMGSLSGDVTGTGLRGEVEATSLNGTVTLRDVEGRSVHAESTSGDIELSTVRSRDIDVSTVSGEVNFSGPIDVGGTYAFQSHSGDVTLRVPSTVSARFSIETFNGELDSDFPVTLQPNRDRRVGRRLEFSVGAGEARVLVESFNGGINIRREQRR
ncbi:MAG TPA: DUF4097 family beta strand repeat-containing protein [Gemmatimonadaceae bacterium]